MAATTDGRKYAAPAARAAAEILLAIARSPAPLTTPEIAGRTEHTKSLVYRVLSELEDSHFVVRTPSGYVLGVAAVELGGAFLTSVPHLSSIRDALRELASLTQETANLGVLQGTDVLYLAREEGELSVVSVSRVGKLLPANATALGKALLAEMSDDAVRREFGPKLKVDGKLTALTPRTLVTLDHLLRDLGKIRARGYSEEQGETVVGRCCIAATVPFGDRGMETAAISVSVAEHRFQEMHGEILAAVLSARDRIAREGFARNAMG
jgi:DNA-binding IclR family transcriptional regulator